MKTLPIYLAAAVILTTATAAPMRAQDDLDAMKGNLATPAPAAAATPKPSAIQATPTAPRTATTTAPRPTPAPAAPRVSVKDELSHGHFVQAGDLAGMAGKKVPAGTFLTGQWQATGEQSGGRREFIDAGLLHTHTTRLFIRFPVAPDPRVLTAKSSTKWEKAAPLRVESIAAVKEGITVYATDVTP